MRNMFIVNKYNFFINIFFSAYFVLIFLKNIVNFTDGVMNAVILLLILLSVLMRPRVFARSLAQLSNETFMRFFILFTLYFLYLSINSIFSINLIIIEYLSVFKWMLFYIFGYIFYGVYAIEKSASKPPLSILLFSIVILIYSILSYKWGAIDYNFGSLFGFYENRIKSVFSYESVFSLFALALFSLYINNYKNNKIISIMMILCSLFFIYMSGSRKALLGLFIIFIFLRSSGGVYGYMLKSLRYSILGLAFIFVTSLSLYKTSVDEYSDPSQPRVFALITSANVAYDNFPIGLGPASLFSGGSYTEYSPYYYEYGISDKWGFGKDDEIQFYNDTYWAQVIAQYGVIGVVLIFFTLFYMMKISKTHTLLISYDKLILLLIFLSFTTPAMQRIEIALFIFFFAGMNSNRRSISTN